MGSVVHIILPNSTPPGCRKSWTWPWETKLVVAVGSPACFQPLFSPYLSRGDQGAARGAPSMPGPLWSPHRTLNSSGRTTSCQTLSKHVPRGELLGSVCYCDLSSENTSILFAWLCSVKIRTPKRWLQTHLFWTGPWSFSVDSWYSTWLFKSYFALERVLHAEVDWDKTLLSFP